MRIGEHLRSFAAEMDALKDRVRHLIDRRHWQTDGEWKESVVRQVLRRHLPASVVVGRGFIVGAARVSKQMDVLIFDAARPVLFRDGDLAFVTPDAVVGVIEVKSRATPGIIRAAASKLAADMEVVRQHPNPTAFSGIFAFEDGGGTTQAYLDAVAGAADSWYKRLDFACIGPRRFLRYWHLDPETAKRLYEGWHSYRLPDTGPGYFVHNVIDAVTPQSVFTNQAVWFPSEGKEVFQDGQMLGSWPSPGRDVSALGTKLGSGKGRRRRG